MPLYADEPEMLTIVLEDALLVGQTINQFIDDWIWNIDSDVRVGGWDKQDNLGRMVYAQVLIDMYLDEVIFAMVYHVRNLDRHGQEEAFARGGEIVAVLEGIFDLQRMPPKLTYSMHKTTYGLNAFSLHNSRLALWLLE